MKSLKDQLPEKFSGRMEKLLGDEYRAFLESYDEKSYAGLRMNTLKITPEEYLALTGQTLEPVSWCPTGFYYNGSREYSKNALYHAGLYYIQEPSAMFPAPGAACGKRRPDFGYVRGAGRKEYGPCGKASGYRTACVQRYQRFPGQGAA